MHRYAVKYDHEAVWGPYTVYVSQDRWWRRMLGLPGWKKLERFETMEKAREWISSREKAPAWTEITTVNG